MNNSHREVQNGKNLLVLLLHAPGNSGHSNEPIFGMTRLQKELFLIQKKLEEERVESTFRKYLMGPYSKEVYGEIERLKSENIIEEKREYFKDRGVYRIFKLTREGNQEVINITKDPITQKIIKIVEQVKKQYNQMNLFELVKFTNQMFLKHMERT